MIKFLVKYGECNNKIPLLCVLEKLNDKYGFPLEIKDYVDYLKIVQYKDIDYDCIEENSFSEVSVLIEFLEIENNNCKVSMWIHYQTKFTQNNKFNPPLVNLDDTKSIQTFFDYIIPFLDELEYEDSELSLEIILPIDYLSQGIKDWHYSRKRRNKKIISKYSYILRIQERFQAINNFWEKKWNQIDKEKSIDTVTTRYLNNITYQEELSKEDVAVLTSQKINNLVEILDDIEEYSVSLALLHLSSDVCENYYAELSQHLIKECKTVIGKKQCQNHSNNNSDILFLLDNPIMRPIQFRNPELNQYGI